MTKDKQGNGHPIYDLLKQLDEKRVCYTITRNRMDVIDVLVTLVGMRLEISVFNDGHLEYSKFEGDESVCSDMSELVSLLEAG